MIAFWSGRAVSANRRLAPGQGRWHASREYTAFKESLAWALKGHAEQIRGPVSVRLWVVLGAQMDTDAIIKPCLDALQQAGVVANDRQVKQLYVHREDRGAGEKDDRIGFHVMEVR